MKLITFVLTLLVATLAAAKPAFTTTAKTTPNAKLLQLRGGGAIGPVDAELVNKVGTTSLALYIGASASKFVAGQTGGTAPDIADVCTNEVFSTLALVNAISTAAYFIGDSGFAADQMGAVLLGAVLVQKALAAGGIDQIVTVAKDNLVLTILFAVSAFVTFA